MGEALLSYGCVRYRVAPAPAPLSEGGVCCPAAAVRQPGYLPYIGGPLALRPRLTTGLPFSLAHTRMRLQTDTNTNTR
jgi:hypothetical protein